MDMVHFEDSPEGEKREEKTNLIEACFFSIFHILYNKCILFL